MLIKKVGIIANVTKGKSAPLTASLREWMLGRGLEVYLEEGIAAQIGVLPGVPGKKIGALVDLLRPRGIFYKNTHQFRELEGLKSYEETAFGVMPEHAEIEENGLKYRVPMAGAQKTGWYFDQRENRAALAPFFKGRRVLDLHTYLGAFAITAAKAGAEAVWAVDSSEKAVEAAEANAALNGVGDKIIFQKEKAEHLLEAMERGQLPEMPDFVLLDPPNIVRNKKHLPQALKMLSRMAGSALKALPPGGYLAVSTCSHHISRGAFVETVSGAAATQPGFFDGAVTGRGPSNSAPHGASTEVISANSPVLVDYSGIFNGYIVDMTRMFVIGTLAPELEHAFATSLAIQSYLVENLRPGVICEDLFLKSLEMAEQAGLGKNYMGVPGENAKFVGHGVGLELDEFPVLAQGFKVPLQAGQTIAIEPKFVLPGLGAIGIENTFAVTPHGGKKLTDLPDDIVCL